ncbi:HAD-IA family hydrolase [Nocardioides sp.]|uniref:HAD-IA family hydrolase n=1 Tax=Nocardioides sp. TaxID=35761 RepID=UPI0019AC59E8|nr:HAD-IA family hydrolase [Nocardioides sp.]MBC7277293.1 HAD-IA family hydrolase [Nocardioides sp.]
MAEPVTVVWCDVGGVLTSPVADAARGLVDAAGLTWTELWEAIDEVAARFGLTGMGPLETGLLSQSEWGTRVTELLPRRPRIDLRRWDEHWYAGRAPNPDLLAGLATLRSTGVRVGLLTNSVREWEPHRALLFDERDFDGVVRSHDLGVRKPDPRIYAEAERILPAPVTATLLVDDTDENCAAARARGWRAVHHIDTAKTIAELLRACV